MTSAELSSIHAAASAVSKWWTNAQV